MSIAPNGKHLYAVLEGATIADETSRPLVRRMFEFDVRAEAFTPRTWEHVVDPQTPLVADMYAVGGKRMVLIERDALIPGTARSVQLVDRRHVRPDGALVKQRVVDLSAVPDPHLISLPESHPGDIGLGDPFRVVCESIEAIFTIDSSRLLLGCDNNLPNTARNPNRADDTELVVIRVPGLKAS